VVLPWAGSRAARPSTMTGGWGPAGRAVGRGPTHGPYPIWLGPEPTCEGPARRAGDGAAGDVRGKLGAVHPMEDATTASLRVLVADGPGEHLQVVTRTVAALGHEVIARESSLPDVARLTATERPDVALVIVADGTAHALQLIDRIVQEARCPVIAILHVQDRGFINEAAKRGIFASIVDGGDPEELQSAIDIVLRRFAEYHNLEGAFGRRAVTERAKGILMERHGIDEHAAFDMLREHSRRTQRKLVDVAEAVVSGHRLLPARPEVPPRSGATER
jgi:AmiR/NasT family two-component response regulator